jgi:HAD superfamily hydrolase (TIGR01549 family)
LKFFNISSELAISRIKRLRAIIFDLDGTLFVSKHIARRMVMAKPGDLFTIWAERRARKRLFGCDLGSAAAYEEEYFSIMAKMTGKDPNVLRSWYFDEYMPRFCAVLQKFYQARPGAAEFFDALESASIKIAVYSDYPCVKERLCALGLSIEPFGTHLYGPEDFGAQKPAKRPFLAIAKNLGCAPESVLVVGDRDDTDGAGALAAGMPYIRITTHRKPFRPEYPSLPWKTFAAMVQEGVEKLNLQQEAL